ncbi:hypothetical protein B0A48_18212 [Cryoendolithus antarcticus]|uniref:Uncharacterized protein n=1 Tax=Cryoendolithus antarcticus TaxID=1507870 RepID=A0A1V8S8Z3_9PEZI|nr:hypothetical protein B0A48_18212 [Cryoendolithus antarcticus]
MRVATDGEDWSISRRQVTDVKIAVDPRHVAICDIGMQYRRASSPIDPEERAALAFRPVLISSSNISADEIPFTRRPRLSALRLDLIHSDAKLLDRLLYKLTTQYDFRSKSVIRNLVTRKYVRGTPFLVRDIRLWFIADPDQVSRTWPVDFAEARERIGSAGRWVGCRFDVVDESEVEGRSEWADVSNEMIGSSGGEVLSDEGQREGVI